MALVGPLVLAGLHPRHEQVTPIGAPVTEPDQPRVERIPTAPDLPHALGRHLHHDPRSRRYAFRAAPSTPLRSVHWERAVPIFDQGDTGSCTGQAAAGWLATANALRPGLTDSADPIFPGAMRVPVGEELALDIYRWNTRNDPYDGTWEPDDTGSDGLTAAKALVSMGAADSYAHAFDVQSVLAALQVGPVLVGTNWYSGMFEPVNDGVINGVVEISGEVAGGHEYLLVGYDVDTTLVTLANSWGPGWANDGYAYMTVETLTRLLAEDGDCTVPHALVAAPPAPAPDPGPGAGFPVALDPDVAVHVAHVAAQRKVEPSAWVNNRLRKYFD
jgi:hypothetical protein